MVGRHLPGPEMECPGRSARPHLRHRPRSPATGVSDLPGAGGPAALPPPQRRLRLLPPPPHGDGLRGRVAEKGLCGAERDDPLADARNLGVRHPPPDHRAATGGGGCRLRGAVPKGHRSRPLNRGGVAYRRRAVAGWQNLGNLLVQPPSSCYDYPTNGLADEVSDCRVAAGLFPEVKSCVMTATSRNWNWSRSPRTRRC